MGPFRTVKPWRRRGQGAPPPRPPATPSFLVRSGAQQGGRSPRQLHARPEFGEDTAPSKSWQRSQKQPTHLSPSQAVAGAATPGTSSGQVGAVRLANSPAAAAGRRVSAPQPRRTCAPHSLPLGARRCPRQSLQQHSPMAAARFVAGSPGSPPAGQCPARHGAASALPDTHAPPRPPGRPC